MLVAPVTVTLRSIDSPPSVVSRNSIRLLAIRMSPAPALASSFVGRPVPETTVACGEVGLGGELRQVGRLDFRLAEASRMGFTTAVVPRSAPQVDAPIELLRVPTLAAALDLLDLRRS